MRKESSLEIQLIQQDHPLWKKVIAFAEHCSWKAGLSLAKRMRGNGFRDWERVIAATDGENIAGYCTVTERDELPEKYEYSPFVGFLFVDEQYRGKRISERMIGEACRYAKTLGYPVMNIMSGERGLYEKYGFEKIGEYETIYGTTEQLFQKAL